MGSESTIFPRSYDFAVAFRNKELAKNFAGKMEDLDSVFHYGSQFMFFVNDVEEGSPWDRDACEFLLKLDEKDFKCIAMPEFGDAIRRGNLKSSLNFNRCSERDFPKGSWVSLKDL